jgi:hypothetical protein
MCWDVVTKSTAARSLGEIMTANKLSSARSGERPHQCSTVMIDIEGEHPVTNRIAQYEMTSWGSEKGFPMLANSKHASTVVFRTATTIALLAATCGLLQAEEGTFAQRRACEPDVVRLCSDFIPDSSAITNCLKRNKRRLSADCRAVMEGRLK